MRERNAMAQEKLYCPDCGRMVSYVIDERKEIFEIRSDKIEITAKVAVCSICGKDLSAPDLEDENLLEAYRQYAKKHGLISPEEIRRIREKYGVNQNVFARILGIGKATIERYEAGALPTESLSNLIKSTESVEFFKKLLEKNKGNLSESDYRKVKEKVDQLATKDSLCEIEKAFRFLNGGEIDFSKLYGVVAAILKYLARGFITKLRLMKLLWFIDTTYCEKYGRPLTNLIYARLPMGPAPHYHDLLLDLLEESGTIEIQREEKEEAEIIKVFPKDISMMRYLDENELEIISDVIKKYGSLNTEQLKELSHQDERWRSARDGELIKL